MLDLPALNVPQAALDAATPNGEQWEAKAELKHREIGYEEVAGKLNAICVSENEPNIRNKLAWGRFTAVFSMHEVTAIGIETINLAKESPDVEYSTADRRRMHRDQPYEPSTVCG